MRLILAIALLALGAAGAQAAEDRYGPRDPAAAPTAGRPWSGTMLDWRGKSPAPTPPAATPPAPSRPALTPGGLYQPGRTPPPPPGFVASGYGLAPAPTPAAATPPPEPRSLYDRPSPLRTPPAALPAPPAAAPVPGGPAAAGAPVRFYSLHREFGPAPDPIPAPPRGESLAFRPEASLAGAVALTGVGDGVRKDDEDDGGLGGVGVEDEAEEAARAAKREAERAAARRAAAGGQ
ncbi:MAG: hypothetical protein ACOY4K_11550 [Pseudomonadota bacterium]